MELDFSKDMEQLEKIVDELIGYLRDEKPERIVDVGLGYVKGKLEEIKRRISKIRKLI